jgi:hypothetical protein
MDSVMTFSETQVEVWNDWLNKAFNLGKLKIKNKNSGQKIFLENTIESWALRSKTTTKSGK